MLTSVAGRTFSYRRGQVIEISAGTAADFCRVGVAEEIPEAPEPAPAKKPAARRPSTKK